QPGYIRKSYLARRLHAVLQFVVRKGAPNGLEDELKHLSELDSVRQHEGYGLVRMIIWATPMLGFLGTVIGITLALGDLSPQALVATPEAAMEGLLAGLSVAFDTTALALTLSIILMFCQFITNQMESSLLESVDQIVDREVVGRFEELGGGTDPHVASITQMSSAVLNTVDSLVERQAEIWERSLRDSQARWNDIMSTAGSNIEVGLETAFRRSIQAHAEELVRNEEAASVRTDRRFEMLQQTLKENAAVMQQQQAELTKQGDLMLQAINATGEVTKVQNALNENMRSLSLMGKFDETVMSLSAAINLLNARLGAPRQNSQRVRLYQEDDRRAA
ncbi:MAG: MotA/TolQ/ExbB proton channel family protein, partial [Planctomycetota bacterium]